MFEKAKLSARKQQKEKLLEPGCLHGRWTALLKSDKCFVPIEVKPIRDDIEFRTANAFIQKFSTSIGLFVPRLDAEVGWRTVEDGRFDKTVTDSGLNLA